MAYKFNLGILYFFTFFFLSSHILLSQISNIQFNHLTIESGLSSSTMRAICQDSSGYIWIGTTDGLNKFDGNNFKVYNHIPGDSFSLSDNFITRLLVDNSESLWIGTLNGLNIFDPASDKFNLVPIGSRSADNTDQPEIISMSMDLDNNLWVGSSIPSGVLKISRKTSAHGNKTESTFFPFPTNKSDTAITEYAFSICFSQKQPGIVWVGTKYGVYKINSTSWSGKPENIQWKKLTKISGQNNTLGNSFVNDIIEDNQGSLWVCYFSGGIDVIIPSIEGDFYRDSIVHVDTVGVMSKEPVNLSSIKDKQGNLWFGTNKNGLRKTNSFVADSGKSFIDFSNFRHIQGNDKSLLSDQVFALFEDNSGLVWVGTDVGISIFDRNKQNFSNTNWILFTDEDEVSVTSIIDAPEFLWIATDDFGLKGYHKRTGQLLSASYSETNSNGLDNNTVLTLLKDHSGNIWAGTTSGLNLIRKNDIESAIGDSKNKRIVTIPVSYKYKPKNKMGSIYELYSLMEDSEKQLWIGSSDGAICMDTKNFTVIKKLDFGTSNAQLARCMFLDKDDHIWIGTEEGLNEVDKSTWQITRYANNSTKNNSLSSNRIASVNQTADGLYWIGTNGGGLNRFDKSKNIFKCYTVQDGLPNNVINAIIDDDKGNLWLSTNNGLSKFNIKEESFTNYNVNDGLKSNGFNIGAAHKSATGELFFGSLKGLNSFYPDSIRKNTFVPNIVIVDFKISDRSIFSNDFPETKSQFLGDKMIELKPHQNNISFEFAALNFINAAKNQYKYKLEGYDDEFISSGNFRFATYTNLDPGEYTFHVIGSNNDGVWNTTGTKISIYLSPPWYKTWWFKIAAGLLLASLIYTITYMRIRAIHERKEKELVQHSAKMKEQFLANMSHEIRTPMNAIMGMTRLMLDNSPRDDQKKYLRSIRQSSDNLLVIINDILDFSKIESGKMELSFVPFAVAELLQNVYETMHLKAEEKGLEFSMKMENEIPPTVLGDPVRISEILINLVGNAIKFTSRGNVRITCRNLGSYIDTQGVVIADIHSIQFSVADTGIGIPEDKIDGIFESFTQASSDTTRRFGGTGLGLTISKHLVEMHGGKISVNSKPNIGTIFTFTLPLEISLSKSIPLREIHSDEIPASLSLLKILLVEDNELNQVVAIDTLQSQLPGITIDVAENGKVALEKIKAHDYDLVLMDIQMPEMDGYTATKIIRSEFTEPKRSIKIIAITAGALKTEVQKCFDCGMNDYISKPFSPEGLMQKLSDMFPAETSS